jgi:hypothetical protein
VTIHQAIEHVSSRWLADSGRNSGDCGVSVVLHIHTLMIDEVLLSGNWQTEECESCNWTDASARSHCRSRGDSVDAELDEFTAKTDHQED